MRKKLTEDERLEWKSLWNKAYAFLLPRGNIVNVSGHWRRRVQSVGRFYYGKLDLLSALMGYLDGHAKARIRKARYRGMKPGSAERQGRLIDLANNGRAIAWDYLKLTGAADKYTDGWATSISSPMEELYCVINPRKRRKK